MNTGRAPVDEAGRLELEKLEASGLIKIASVDPELEYLFRHWLIQQTAYSSLLKRERRRLHLLIGNTLESLYPDRLDELAPSLALHFDEAGDTGRALRYLLRSGRMALERHGLHEAADFFLRALTLLTGAQEEELLRMRIEAALGAVEAGWAFTPPETLMKAMEQAFRDAEILEDQRTLATLLSWMVSFRRQQGERYGTSPELTEVTDRLRGIIQEVGDETIRAVPLARVGMVLLFSGLVQEGTRDLAEAIPLLERLGKSLEAASALGVLGIFYARLGEFDKAQEAIDRQQVLAAAGDPVARMDVLLTRSNVELVRGNVDRALELGRTCTVQADELGVTACAIGSRLVVGAAQLMKGRPDLAAPYFERGDELSLVSWKFWRPLLKAFLASAHAMMGRKESARTGWQAALDNALAIGDTFTEANIRTLRASALFQDPEEDLGGILSDLEIAAAIYEKSGAKPFLARTLMTYAPALARAGRAGEARAALERSAGVFEEVGLADEARQARDDLGGLGNLNVPAFP